MGELSLKKLVEITGYADSRVLSVSTEHGARPGKAGKGCGASEPEQEQERQVFSHRRALRVV